MRGGVSYIANLYGKANNKYMEEYNEKPPSIYIIYLDANNLYGWAMSQYLPTGNFKWMSDKEIKKIDLGKYKADGKKGLILEVDLEYPQELHDLHNDYLVCPEKVKVSNDMLSGSCKKIAEKYNISIGLVSKLIPMLKDKKEYVLHYRNLQLYLDLGLKIKKVHRVLEFNQSPWLNPILPGGGGEYAPLLFFFHHPKTVQGIKLKLSDFKDTLLRHILQVKPVS